MCGIGGIVGNSNPGKRRAALQLISDRMIHRGPDASGFFEDDDVSLCHRRLSVIDLSDAANQPMEDSSGRYVLVFNGEIYNYREVRDSLPDYPFRTNSDTEVILAAYAAWGPGCLAHFNGMYGLAIWDKLEKCLFLTRGRLGVKPLYFCQAEDSFIFASELRAVLAGIKSAPRLHLNGIYNFLLYQSVYGPDTPVEGIEQLMPGEYALYKQGRLDRYTYWRIEDAVPFEKGIDKQTVQKQVRQLLTESVQRRMVSDVPLGAFLSGGIDSSAVVGLMAECSEQPIHTFAITFREPEFDESRYSTLIARRFNTRHTSILLHPQDFLESFPDALQAMDNPSGDGFNTYLVSKVTKQAGITVALSGIGGDELFAGYGSFERWLRLHRQRSWQLPRTLRSLAGRAFLSMRRTIRAERMAHLLSAESGSIEWIYPGLRHVIAPVRARTLLNGVDGCFDRMHLILAERKDGFQKLPLLSQYSAAELLGYTLNVLLKDTDQMSMASALEVREPFFDYKLVEYVLGIPDELKYPTYPKSLLVESLKPMLPDEIVHRPKMGFTLPWKNWLHTELRSWCTARLASIADRPEFDGDAVRKIERAFFRNPESKEWMPVFQLAVLEDWLTKNFHS